MPEPRRRLAAASRAGLLLAALLVTGCYGVDYRFLAVDGGGTPVAQRCGSMPFRINPHGADAEWQLVAVVRAVQRLEATTGVDWRFDGYTGERIATGFDPRLDGGRVLIEFTSFDAPGTPSAYGHPKPSGVATATSAATSTSGRPGSGASRPPNSGPSSSTSSAMCGAWTTRVRRRSRSS